jgi:xanthine dehydrogenase accessory factor
LKTEKLKMDGHNIYEAIDDLLDKGKSGILATITRRLGPTPQGIGAKVFINDTGKIFGTIGGGCVEAEVLKEAREIILTGGIKTIHYIMNNTDVAEQGMICGGSVDIFLEPVTPKHQELYRELKTRIKNGTNTFIVTKTTPGQFSKSLLSGDGKVFGDQLDPAVVPALLEKFKEKQLIFTEGLLVEPMVKTNRIFIYGAGHISQFIAEIAKMIDFHVTVIDDRIAFANRERFPDADRIIAGYFTEVIKELDLKSSDYHVIVTRGHRNDAEVLEGVLKHPFLYVGMIGSKRKTKLVFDYLKSEGFKSEQLENVHSPIGLGISAQTPQEIAVSIAAELIQVRRSTK